MTSPGNLQSNPRRVGEVLGEEDSNRLEEEDSNRLVVEGSNRLVVEGRGAARNRRNTQP